MKIRSAFHRIDQCYAINSFKERLFIKIRYLTCPFDLLMNQVKDHTSILDIGCGYGLFLNLVKSSHPHMHCVGYDHDERKIAAARSSIQTKGISFLHPDELKALPKKSFDCVSIIDVLYSIPKENWPAVLSLAGSFLKPHGTLMIKETVNTPHLKYLICQFQETIAIHILKYTKGTAPFLPHWSYFMERIKAAGFINSRHQRVDRYYPWPHHLFLAEKP